jgi:tetratricopeptide (TPR) repeat protein
MYRNSIKSFLKVAEADTLKLFKDLWSKLADCYFKVGVPDSAQIVSEKGLKFFPENIYLHRSVAHIYTGRDMIQDAIRHYETIVKLDPKATDDWKKLGNLYLKENEMEPAIEAFEMTTELNPQDQESNDILSRLYTQTGNQDAAMDRIEKVRQQDPTNPKYMFSLGRQYFVRELYPKAEPEFREYLKYVPDDDIAREYLGAALQNQEKYQESINVYSTILERNPNHTKSLCEIGSCLKSLGRFRDARVSVDKALKIDSEYYYAYIVRGEIYEATADKCMQAEGRNSPDWDDKLIYQLAYDQYEKAKADPALKNLADRKLDYVKQLIPTAEDRFMHKSDAKAKVACYQWIY